MGPCQGEKPVFSIPEEKKRKRKARSETSSPSGRVIELQGTDVTSSYLRLQKQHHQS